MTIKSKTDAHRREFLSFRDQMDVDLKALGGDLNSLNDSVNNLSDSLQEHKQDLNSLNDSVNNLSDCLQGLKQQTAYKLAEVQTSLSSTNSKLDTLNATTTQHSTDFQEIQTKITNAEQQTVGKLAELQTSLSNTNSRLAITTAQLSTGLQEIQTNISNVECLDAQEFLQLYEYLQTNITHEPEKEEENVTNNCEMYMCGGTGGWRRVVYLDMTDPSTTCPSGWRLTGYSKRTCGRVSTGRSICDSVFFPVSGGEYNKVCGRIKAYQWGSPDGFHPPQQAPTMDSVYVDGISVTHGNPRQHIWTFAGGLSEDTSVCPECACPCDSNSAVPAPAFVGEDYFCESGLHEPWAYRQFVLFPNDPLWDGQNCPSSSTCCSLHNPPYFVKQLPSSTADSIEARICLSQQNTDEDIAVEVVELYVQ